MMELQRDNLVLGRGSLYFNIFGSTPFVGLGERYLGNSPAVSFQTSREIQPIIDSVGGVLVRTDSLVISESASASFTTDNVSVENLAAWFNATGTGVAASSGIVVTSVKAYRGLFYQMGVTADNPIGRRNFVSVIVRKGGVDIEMAGNYQFDLTDGRLYVLPGATAISDGDDLLLTGVAEATQESVLVPAGSVVTGSLRFVAYTLHGKGQDYFFPSAELQAAGDLQLKGDAWQELRFNVTARKRPRQKLYYVAARG